MAFYTVNSHGSNYKIDGKENSYVRAPDLKIC